MGIVYYVKTTFHTSLADVATLQGYAVALGAATVASDTAIAATLIMLLYDSKNGFSRTDHAIQQLTIFTMTTGFATSVFAIGDLITTVRLSGLVFLAFYFPLSKLYTNSLLMTLNIRRMLRGTISNTVSLGSLPFNKQSAARSKSPAVHVTSDVMVDVSPSTMQTKEDGTAGGSYELSVFHQAMKENAV